MVSDMGIDNARFLHDSIPPVYLVRYKVFEKYKKRIKQVIDGVHPRIPFNQVTTFYLNLL